jgi:hypothetical protein
MLTDAFVPLTDVSGLLTAIGRALARKRSLVQSQYRPPHFCR